MAGQSKLRFLRTCVVTLCVSAHGCAPALVPQRPAVPERAAFEWNLPPGFPRPVVPADNPQSDAKVELGRRLFYDPSLSGNGTFACASCHRQELAFTDGHGRSIGSTGELHPRGAMSLTNVAYNATFNWDDPTLVRLEDQAALPMFNVDPPELGLSGKTDELLSRLAADPLYPRQFDDAFGERRITIRRIVQALASFERTLISGDSPYDRLVFGGETAALSASAWRGMTLFFSDALGCSGCHAGFNFSGPVRHAARPEARARFHNTGLYHLDRDGSYPEANPGLVRFTGRTADRGRFRAPTLRNVAVTAPYMHDGSIATLEGVLEHYASGGRTIRSGPNAGHGSANPQRDSRITGFELTAEASSDLVEFLHSLTDRGFLENPHFSDPCGTSSTRPSPPRH